MVFLDTEDVSDVFRLYIFWWRWFFLSNLATGYVQNYWDRKAAGRQMSFQREMSNTAHRREVADLYAAGLNPILSAKYGGASTPSGALSNNTGAILGNTVSTAQAAEKLKDEINLIRAQSATTRDVGDNSRADAQKKIKEAKLIDEQIKTEKERVKQTANTAKAVELNLEGLKNEAEIDKTRFGETMRYIKRAIDAISPFTNMRDFKTGK
ncbi:hypothetical protein [Eel River basin pequenovirus]|nr:hypothetical protein [Eel River basin pequenovirus]